MKVYEITRKQHDYVCVDVLALTDDELQEYAELYKEQGYEVTYKEVIL